MSFLHNHLETRRNNAKIIPIELIVYYVNKKNVKRISLYKKMNESS